MKDLSSLYTLQEMIDILTSFGYNCYNVPFIDTSDRYNLDEKIYVQVAAKHFDEQTLVKIAEKSDSLYSFTQTWGLRNTFSALLQEKVKILLSDLLKSPKQ